MMQKTFILTLMFFTLILTGCQEKTVAKKSSSSNSLVCSGQAYWTTPGCTGYCQYQPTAAGCNGSTTGGTTGAPTLNCNGNAYWTTPGCTGYCTNYPTATGCSGTTAAGTAGGSSTGLSCTTASSPICSNYCSTFPSAYGCLPNGTNCYITPTASGCPGSSTPITPGWGTQYPGGEPAGYCSPLRAVDGAPTAHDVRKATLTGTGLTSGSIEYNPLTAGNYLTTSTMLKSVSGAKTFFLTDSMLKLRIKVKPQPASAQTSTMCYGRVPGATIPGYTSLRYRVKVYGVTASNSMNFLADLGEFTTGVNSCSQAIDLSYYKEVSPSGVVVSIDKVQANQNCWASSYNGYAGCTLYRNVRSIDCWSMDFEVAADGTKTFD